MRFTFALLCSFVAATSARAIYNGQPRPLVENAASPPIAPSKDPWYKAPDGFETAKPGDVLKARDAPALVALTGNASTAHQLLFRTTDSNDRPSWAVTTVFAPLQNSTCNAKLLSYQIPYNSPNVDTSPSYALYQGPLSLFNNHDIADSLGRGWWVNVPDHEGPKAAFSAGLNAGRNTLDSIRAARLFATRGGLQAGARTALWGYSGGSLPTNWALELQGAYAPELALAGAAAGGLIPNVTSTFFALNGQLTAALVPLGVLGMVSQYPEASAYIQGQLNHSSGAAPWDATTFDSVLKCTLIDAVLTFMGKDVTKYFEDGIDALLRVPFFDLVRKEGLLGFNGTPQVPSYFYKSTRDQISSIRDTDSLVSTYCSRGATIEYIRNPASDHFTEQDAGRAGALAFLESVLEGRYDRVGCSTKDVFIPFSV